MKPPTPLAVPIPVLAPTKRSFTALNILDAANTGVRMVILDLVGKPTEDWLHVLGADSTQHQAARNTMRRRIYAYVETNGEAAKDTNEYSAFTVAEQRKAQASLVGGWSFAEPCTQDNVVALLTQAPYVAEQVDELAGNRARFVKA